MANAIKAKTKTTDRSQAMLTWLNDTDEGLDLQADLCADGDDWHFAFETDEDGFSSHCERLAVIDSVEYRLQCSVEGDHYDDITIGQLVEVQETVPACV